MLRVVTSHGDEVRLAIRAKPRGGRSALGRVVEGPGGARLEVRIGAAPVDGAANEELLRFLAREVLGVPASALSVRSGERGKDKVVAIRGVTAAAVAERLGAWAAR